VTAQTRGLIEACLGCMAGTPVATVNEVTANLHGLHEIERKGDGSAVAIGTEGALMALPTQGVGGSCPGSVLFQEAGRMPNEVQFFPIVVVEIRVTSGAVQGGHVVGMATVGASAHGWNDRLEGGHTRLTHARAVASHAAADAHLFT